MAKPTTLPLWCTTGTKTTPSGGKQATGWELDERPAYEYFNWWMNNVYSWASYLDGIIEAGGAKLQLIGISGTAGADDILVSDGTPGIRFKDTTGGELDFRLGVDGNFCKLSVDNDNDAAIDSSGHYDDFPNAIVIDGSNNVAYVGFGVLPTAVFHIQARSGSVADVPFRMSSTDTAHGMTDTAPTTTFFQISRDTTNYQPKLLGFTTGAIAFQILASCTSPNSTSTTAGTGATQVEAFKKSGTGVTSLGSSDNVFVVRNNGSTNLIVKGNGDLYIDGTTTAYDDEQDALACHDAMYALARDPGKVLTYNKEKLSKLGVMSEEGFVNIRPMFGLALGGIGELYRVVEHLLGKLGMDYETIRKEIRAC